MKRKFKHNNDRTIGRIHNKLYLDARTADYFFEFASDTDQPVRVPAHKSILAAGSQVFDEMFYGGEKCHNVTYSSSSDAPAEAFKEFSQFFYLTNVELTSENIVDVTNLCMKFEMIECMKVCEISFKNSMSLKTLCSSYAHALKLQHDNLMKFCKQKLIENAKIVLKSFSFLECEQEVMGELMKLVSSKCSLLEQKDAVMKWAKETCIRNNVKVTPENLRTQLGDSFDFILTLFGKLDLNEFINFTRSYKGFFTLEEYQAVVEKIEQRRRNKRRTNESKTDGPRVKKEKLG